MRLAQLGQVNWDQLEQTDPVQAMSLQRQMRDLQAARAQVANQITTKQQQRALTEQQEIAKQVQEAAAVLQRGSKAGDRRKSSKSPTSRSVLGSRTSKSEASLTLVWSRCFMTRWCLTSFAPKRKQSPNLKRSPLP